MQIPFQLGPSPKGDEKSAVIEAETDVDDAVPTTFGHVFDAANPKAQPMLTVELEAELQTVKVSSAEEGNEPPVVGEEGEDLSVIDDALADAEIPKAATQSADLKAEAALSAEIPRSQNQAIPVTETAQTARQRDVQPDGLVDSGGPSAKTSSADQQTFTSNSLNRIAAEEATDVPVEARRFAVDDKVNTPRVNDGATPIKTTPAEKAYVVPPPSQLETIAAAKMLDVSTLRSSIAGQQPLEHQIGTSIQSPLQMVQVPTAAATAPVIQLDKMASSADAQTDHSSNTARDVPHQSGVTRDLAALPSTPGLQNVGATFVHTTPVQNQTQVTQSAASLLQTIEVSERGKTTRFDAVETITWDVRGAVSTSHAPTVLPTKVEMPPHITQAIAQSLHASGDKSVEIALNPAELGRVRIIMTPSETGMTVNILADRPETLDLMRRNIDDLGRSISDLGYEDINFSFGQDDTSADASERHEGEGDTLALDVDLVEHTAPPNSQLSALAIAPDGIDMRL